ncbi:putative NADH dehydrogenase-like protein YjlD [Candidatus Kuenenia stuttgartiensis]|jgi:NADH dehydrogenase|uniref:NADH:ubiquinone reductase (non-electrogenic) n=1 Tax=Kuenenia stuttgartiensis TaxID=174633 RepID=Q1Q0D2_KUEST|nr:MULTISPECIES: NAD(P)/FAD-dependent oxidoreductase [Kuenenia]MBW7943245.1 NAD(P)/FAD-dependent oxidoreductase [Candidatus Kuenenia stuttgartiensis]MBZ0193078.1 NAD(P)/FAD-dependent oxidoreductase [Candidatus Kuenenia stuttgartiensis]MCF6151063.1 NAD(P)/FAD-dependent oxidoreductase [Candidatus Kuenenia stuttgartiensis]MCL4728324.1 NAD(P)/FAD-dependent oxidoreductase [Candidatus Kuenenia stuttgartiensis]MCZ7623490.1 NAD(P)/FAD-dependent oxidoreductase [Candidatus Kuenenia sp.]
MESKKNIVVVGAGYGGITSVLRLARLFRKHPEYQIHLIDRNPYHTLKTQLHEAAVRKREVSIPINRIIQGRNIIFHLGEVTRIDAKEHIVYMEGGALPFHYLVIALGSQVNFHNIPGLQENSFSLQTLRDAQQIYAHIDKLCARAASEPNEELRRDMLRFVIGGGGLSGIEFAAELADYTVHCTHNCHVNSNEVEIIIVESGDHIVPRMEASFATRIHKKLLEKGVKIITRTKIISRTSDTTTLSSGEVVKTKTVIWTGGTRIHELIGESGMKIGQSGRIVVDEFLQVEGYPFIYAIGDNALAINPYSKQPVPAAAQFALQQGRLVAYNVYADIFRGMRKPYHPKVLGEVVSLGRHLAVGWFALPLLKKITFVGFLGSLLKTAIQEKHIFLLRKESRNWITY